VKLIGLSADAKRLVVLSEGPRDTEAKQKPPKNLRGLERNIFKQHHDGKTGILTEYGTGSGKPVRQQTVFYNPGGYRGLLVGDNFSLVLSYSNLNAVWKGGKLELFHAQNSYNYAAGISPDRKWFMTGGLRDGSLVQSNGLAVKKFRTGPLPGWPEYYTGFGAGPDGTAYGVTTAYRLVVVGPGGNLIKVVPLY
jgi:hypothetical protein